MKYLKCLVCYIIFGLVIFANNRYVLAHDKNKEALDIADHSGVMPAGMQRYVIFMHDCTIEFVAKKGGYTRAYMEGGNFYGDFSLSHQAAQKSLNFSLNCRKGAAADLCSKLLPVEDAENIRYYKIHRLERLHPSYFGVAQISSYPINSFQPGQVRELDFCLGDGLRTLRTDRGGIELGYDSRDISETVGRSLQKSSERALPEILEIIRSIRFLSSDDEVDEGRIFIPMGVGDNFIISRDIA
ncbi:hypothetical protein BLA9940_01404 [Burkholderia aenigmatica]|uniref:Uncharacterized protein n=1 Tax=Burkholderia aenigmatica TaxID=2015348 RepID=A0A6J5J3M0_9BURK|nr:MULTISPECIES: hypothetical protein [Burkholderia]CAB3966135.1 hypothetical protein BLA3211_03757 [Burkholderia aenigmatica]VWC49781.1 hypothetical protein BLA9940_01404 [Burkholderia aenigmatica]